MIIFLQFLIDIRNIIDIVPKLDLAFERNKCKVVSILKCSI